MLIELLYLLALSLVSFLWLAPGQMIIGHDSGVRLNIWDYWRDTFFSWNPGVNFGKDWAIAKGFLVTKLPELILTDIFGNTLGQQLTIAFWLFVMGVSMYIAIRLLFPTASRLMRLWASTLYMYNFFVLQGWWIFERAKFATYAALPLVFAFLYKGLTKQYSVFTTAVLISITLFFGNGGGSPPLYGALLVTGTTTLVVMTIINIKKHGRKELAYSAKLLSAIIGTWFLLNAYWIVPEAYLYATSYASMLASMGGTEGILSWEAMFSTNASWPNILRLQGIPGWEAPDHPYSHLFMNNPLLIIASFIPLLLSLATLVLLILRRHSGSSRIETPQRDILLLLLILLPVGVFFTAGTHPPLGFLYAALIKYLPGFAIFRSSYFKFAPTIFFAISLLSAYSISLLLQRPPFLRGNVGRGAFTLIVLVMLITYHFPYFQSSAFRWIPPFTTKLTVPAYAYEAAEYLNQNTKPTDRILLLPPLDPTFHQDSYTWGYWSLAPFLRNAVSRPILANDSNNPPTIVEALYQSIASTDAEQFTRLARIAGVTHILWRDDTLANDEQPMDKSFLSLRHSFNSLADVTKEKDFGAWVLYRVDTAATPIVSTASYIVHVVDPTFDIASAIAVTPDAPLVIDSGEYTASSASQLIRARCIYCRAKDREQLAQTAHQIQSRFQPDHPLYGIARLKERIQLVQAKTPEAKIDAHITFILKRKSEMEIMPGSPRRDALMNETFSHSSEIEKLLKEMEGFPLYTYAAKLDSYGLLRYVVDSIIQTPSEASIERLIAWAPTDGWYTLRIAEKTEATTILINRIPTPNGAKVQLAKGLHRIDIPIPQEKTATDAPAVYLERDIASSPSQSIQPISTLINPTLIKVQMPKSDTSALLTFNQHFAPGWKLVGPQETKGAQHIQVYGYANGWIIPKLDEPTTFTLTYFPQQIFYIGLGITTISFATLAVILFLNRKKR